MKTKRKMLLSALAAFLSFLLPATTCAQTTKTITLNYSEDDFNFEYNTEGELMITSQTLQIYYNYDESKPALPYINVRVLIGIQEVFDSLTIDVQSHIALTNVIMAHAPILQKVGTSRTASVPKDTLWSADFMKKSYPRTSVYYKGDHIMSGYKILNFQICPFVYHVNEQSLELVDAISLNIHKHELSTRISSNEAGLRRMRDYVAGSVVNSEDISILYPLSIANRDGNTPPNLSSTSVQYLIITDSYLAPEFEPLAQWKTKKGVKTEIVTINQIYANDSTNDSHPLKIKKFIKNYRQINPELYYILMGGIGTRIPTQECYIYNPVVNEIVDSLIHEFVPCDLYYACLDGEEVNKSFAWDGNGNGLIGELSDNIDEAPDICVTRLPVNMKPDVEDFVNRIIEYEGHPSVSTWKNQIMLCGVQMGNNASMNPSDAQLKNENLYNENIGPYWDGSRVRFYDTATDFEGGASYDVTADHLQEQLEQGYHFVNVMTHGAPTYWQMEIGNGYASLQNAQNLQNSGLTIITTSACNTNDFSNPVCLSSYLMRSSNHGIVAYIGTTKENVGVHNNGLLLAGDEVLANFYKTAFQNSFEVKLGNVFKNTISDINESDMVQRWLKCNWNACGDPEMPIYTTTPKDMSDVDFEINYRDELVITGIDTSEGISYCIMDTETEGNNYYNNNPYTDHGILEIDIDLLPDDFLLYVNRFNHPVKIYEFIKGSNVIYVQNKSFKTDAKIWGHSIIMGSHVTNGKPVGPVVIESGKTEIKTSKGVVINGEFEVKRGAEFSIEIGQLPW